MRDTCLAVCLPSLKTNMDLCFGFMTSQGYVTMFHGKTKVNTALRTNIHTVVDKGIGDGC
jgi:hypothetical protein